MPGRGKTVVANWKMNGTAAMAASLVRAVQACADGSVRVILCPPATLLAPLGVQLTGSGVHLGGQDCHEEASGAFTGDISAPMLKDSGASCVILGHSERRHGHGESSALIARKAKAALSADLEIILCVGETLAERQAGKALAVIEEQLHQSLPPEASPEVVMVAYEPVWAIGSGLVPKNEEIEEAHRHIGAVLAQKYGSGPENIRVMYGGSVKASNAAEIMGLAGVGGVLVGGASLKAEEFCAIVKAAH